MERFKATARCTTDSVMRHFAYPVMEPHPDGDYVPYATAQAEIARLTQRAEKAEALAGAMREAAASETAKAEAYRKRAIAAEGERDVIAAAAFDESTKEIIAHGSGEANGLPRHSLDEKLCCDGHHCGCQGATLGDYLVYRISALTPSDARYALAARDAAKVAEGMRHMLNRLRHEGNINPSLTYSDAIEWAEAILAAMQKEGGA